MDKFDNFDDNIIPCVVEGGYNTSYINALLTTLFYRENEYIKELLTSEPLLPAAYYLQEIIKSNFVEPLRRHFSIKFDIFNEIRNYLLINGFLNNFNIIDSIKNNSIDLLFDFIIDFLNGNKLEFDIMKIRDGQIIEKDKKLKTSIIKINIDNFTETNTSIKKEFIKWLKFNVLNNDEEFYSYEIKKMPNYICFYFNRINKEETNIDIMKKIKFFINCNPTQNCIKYKIHGLVCKENNKFYSILTNNNKWLMFTENKIPSLEYISMSDDDMIEKIQKEVIFVIYTLD
jgi:hypothetical protein